MILRADGHVPLLRENHVSNDKNHGINEIFDLWDVTQRIWVVSYRRFGTTYQSHFKGQAVQDPWQLKMTLKRCPETSVPSYQSTLLNIPQELIPNSHQNGTLKSRTLYIH
jgi:hypothetical protein